MPKSYSKKRTRDDALIAHWGNRDDSAFASLGLTRDGIVALQRQLTGYIVMPGDPSYDADRLLENPIFNPSPAFIVYCETEGDVALALGLSGEASMPFAVRSGGHCTAGYSSGAGVLIDVSKLNHVSVDACALTATVQAGCDFGRFNQELERHGVHTPGGECSGVCIGGYVQGGGIGFTSGTYGMNCDNVVSMRVMLADGSVVICSETQNLDLWWAMRGGTGGNFGILINVTYRVFAMDKVFGWALAWKMSNETEIANCVRAMAVMQELYMNEQVYGPQLTTQVLICYQSQIVPDGETFDPIPIFMIRGLWVGDEASGKETMAPLMRLEGCIPSFTVYDKYTAVLNELLNTPEEQPVFPDPTSDPFEGKASRFVERDLDGAEWTSLFKLFLYEAPNTYTYMYLELYGGKMGEWTIEDNAYVHRTVHFDAVLDVFWFLNSERAENESFLQKWNNLLETFWNNGSYQNYCSVNVPDYKLNYWKEALPGLVGTKCKYDPLRKFQFAQMVPYEVPASYPYTEIPANVAASLAAPIDYTGGVVPALKP